jgi:hypothetical protein
LRPLLQPRLLNTLMTSELSVPCCLTVLPPPMYTINAPKHALPTPCFIHLHQPLHILLIGSSEVLNSDYTEGEMCRDLTVKGEWRDVRHEYLLRGSVWPERFKSRPRGDGGSRIS